MARGAGHQVDQLSFQLLISEFQMNIRLCIVSDSRQLLVITLPYTYVMSVLSAVQFKKCLYVISRGVRTVFHHIPTWYAETNVLLAYFHVKIHTLLTAYCEYFRYNEFAHNRSSETSTPVNTPSFVYIKYIYFRLYFYFVLYFLHNICYNAL